jgi:hypothetical protein
MIKRDLISLQKVNENPALAVLKASRSVLLLQGPVGPFFDRLSQWLMARSKEVHRIVFSGGDQHDCKVIAPIKFVGSLNEWDRFFEEQLEYSRIKIDSFEKKIFIIKDLSNSQNLIKKDAVYKDEKSGQVVNLSTKGQQDKINAIERAVNTVIQIIDECFIVF